MRMIIRSAWLPVIALLGVTTAVLGLASPESTSQSIKIWDAALYDSEDCKPGPEVEIACPDYTMRIQGKGFTSHIQIVCDSQIADSRARKCSIPVDMKLFRDQWGFHDPSTHHHKSMWVDYECNPGSPRSERLRVFGAEETDTRPSTHISISCD
jgi:hypothetical protein